MKSVYEVVGGSKQLHHYYRQRCKEDALHLQQIRQHIQVQRAKNRRLGLKKLYHLMTDCPVGRDKFITIATSIGLGLKLGPPMRTKEVR